MSAPFSRHSGIAAPLMIDNVDTDQIIPSREMKSVGRSGLGNGLFAGWRYSSGRVPRPDFVLNRPAYRDATILLSGSNFGCGSSREHAVWALGEYGVRAIVAVSFGEIFFGNCVRNGILPIKLGEREVRQLAAMSDVNPPTPLHIDLLDQSVRCGDVRFSFDIDTYAKRLLVEGLDPISLTLQDRAEIDAFLKRDDVARPWLYN